MIGSALAGFGAPDLLQVRSAIACAGQPIGVGTVRDIHLTFNDRNTLLCHAQGIGRAPPAACVDNCRHRLASAGRITSIGEGMTYIKQQLTSLIRTRNV